MCEPAVEIIEAQRREIDDALTWLIEEIEANDPAATETEAADLPGPRIPGVCHPDGRGTAFLSWEVG